VKARRVRAVKLARPISTSAPLLVVPVRVNGSGPLRFLLDTGASHSCVSPQLAERLGLARRGRATALGAGGALELRLAAVESLRVGPAEVKALTVAIVDIAHVEQLVRGLDGVLGNDFLRRFVVTLDYRKGTVKLA
jgi:predicted aspartyl protease